jgi:hypothetical protein
MPDIKELVAQAPAVTGGWLRQVVNFGIDGRAAFPGARDTAVKRLAAKGEREAAIDSLVAQHIALASAQGFVTSLGGVVTIPVGLPANIAGMAVLGVRMVAGLAHLRGYDIDDRRTRAAVTLAILGQDDVERLVNTGRLPARPLTVATAPVYDLELERQISEQVMGALASRYGGKHLASIALRRVPVLGGGVGAAVDGWSTLTLADYARREFVGRQTK